MQKVAVVGTILFLASAAVALAATQTDSVNYATIPAHVLYSGYVNIDLAVYTTADLSAPQANLAGGTSPASAYLDAVAWTSGAFASSTVGNYIVVQASVAGCAALSYTNCAAANPGMPGDHETSFSIGAEAPTSSTASTTLSAGDALLTYLFFIVDAGWLILLIALFSTLLLYIFVIKKK